MNKRGVLEATISAMYTSFQYKHTYLFYAHMVGQCNIIMDDELDAAAGVSFSNDHFNLHINNARFDIYDINERLAILKHEMLHILEGHLLRLDNRNFEIWNYATDCAINQYIDRDHLPITAITPKTLGKKLGYTVPNDKTSDYYYSMLDQGDFTPPPSSDGGMMDDHKTWEQSTGSKEFQSDLSKRMIETAIKETEKNNGTVPNKFSEWLEIHSRNAEIDWRKVLRTIVGNKKVGKRPTFKRPNRRFPNREDIKGHTKIKKFNLLVIADVSGSMSDSEVNDTLGEVRNICDITRTPVDLIQVDTEAYEPEKLSKKTKVIERKGNGGTFLYPAIELAKDRNIQFDAIVVLTDGGLFNADIKKFAELKTKIIWLVSSKGYIKDEMEEGKMQAFKLKERNE